MASIVDDLLADEHSLRVTSYTIPVAILTFKVI